MGGGGCGRWGGQQVRGQDAEVDDGEGEPDHGGFEFSTAEREEGEKSSQDGVIRGVMGEELKNPPGFGQEGEALNEECSG